MKNIRYIIAFAVTITFSSCSTETSFYDTLSEAQRAAATGFDPTTEGFQNLLEQTYTVFALDLGIELNEGANPPDLNGTYQIFPVEVSADLDDPNLIPYEINEVYIEINFSGQNGLTIDYQGVFWNTGIDGIPGGIDDVELFRETNAELFDETYLSGNADTGLFTLFATVLTQPNEPGGPTSDELVDIIIISGQRTADGINNLEYAYVSLDGNDIETSPILYGQTYRDANFESLNQ